MWGVIMEILFDILMEVLFEGIFDFMGWGFEKGTDKKVSKGVRCLVFAVSSLLLIAVVAMFVFLGVQIFKATKIGGTLYALITLSFSGWIIFRIRKVREDKTVK